MIRPVEPPREPEVLVAPTAKPPLRAAARMDSPARRPKSFAWKLRRAILLPTGLAVALVSTILVYFEWRHMRGEVEARLGVLAEMLASASASALMFSDPENAERTLAAVRAEKAIRNAALYDAEGNLFAQFRDPGATRPLPARPPPDGLSEESGRLNIAHPVIEGGRRYGTLFLRWDLQPLYLQLRGHAVMVAMVIAGALLATAIAARIFEDSISRPVQEFAGTARLVAADRNYGLRVPAQQTVELAALADAMNHLLRETQASQARLADEVAATHRAERRVSAILASISDGFLSFDHEWRYTLISDQAQELLGTPREALLGRSLWDAYPALRGTEFERIVRGVMERREAVTAELYYAAWDRWFENRVYPSDGGVSVFFADITARKKTEESLRRWEFIFSRAGWAVVVANPATNCITLANPAFAAMHGYTMDELIGRPIADMREPARRGDVPRQAQIAADAGEYVFESVHQRKDGTTFPVIIHVSVLKDAAGVPLYRAATVQDITDRKRTEQALRASEEQLRLVTDAIPALISYVDAELRYRFVNRQYEVWFQRPRSEVLGRHMEEILGEVAFARLKPHLDAALRGEMVEFEVEAPYRSGRARWIHAHYIPHRNREGVVVGLMVLVLDTTERRRMEESLARAHAELEQHNRTLDATVQDRTAKLREVIGELEAFSYSIAHDMRAPLRSMQGFSRLLLEDHAAQLDDEGRSFLKRIIASADRLDRLIQDVLNYSKVVRSDLPLEPVDLETLIKEIIGSYPNLQAPQATITVQPPLPRVLGNSAALTQVVSNLLGNAVKFVKSGTHPQVRIWAEAVAAEPGAAGDTGAVRFWFEDNGIGIPKDSQHRLFAMFQRLNRPELYEGTGIGLAIVRKAVERMGGTLGVESETGAGSRFWVQLRRADTA